MGLDIVRLQNDKIALAPTQKVPIAAAHDAEHPLISQTARLAVHVRGHLPSAQAPHDAATSPTSEAERARHVRKAGCFDRPCGVAAGMVLPNGMADRPRSVSSTMMSSPPCATPVAGKLPSALVSERYSHTPHAPLAPGSPIPEYPANPCPGLGCCHRPGPRLGVGKPWVVVRIPSSRHECDPVPAEWDSSPGVLQAADGIQKGLKGNAKVLVASFVRSRLPNGQPYPFYLASWASRGSNYKAPKLEPGAGLTVPTGP
jgi:hypothetical protein